MSIDKKFTLDLNITGPDHLKLLIEIAEEYGFKFHGNVEDVSFDATDWNYLGFNTADSIQLCNYKSDHHLENFTFQKFKKALKDEYDWNDQPFDEFHGWYVEFREDSVEIGCKTYTKEEIRDLFNNLKKTKYFSTDLTISFEGEDIEPFIIKAYNYYYE